MRGFWVFGRIWATTLPCSDYFPFRDFQLGMCIWEAATLGWSILMLSSFCAKWNESHTLVLNLGSSLTAVWYTSPRCTGTEDRLSHYIIGFFSVGKLLWHHQLKTIFSTSMIFPQKLRCSFDKTSRESTSHHLCCCSYDLMEA